MSETKKSHAIVAGQLEISINDMQAIYNGSGFVKDYHKKVQQLLKDVLKVEMNCNKKFDGAQTLSIFLRCKQCRANATLSLKKFKLSFDPTIWDYTGSCVHAETGDIETLSATEQIVPIEAQFIVTEQVVIQEADQQESSPYMADAVDSNMANSIENATFDSQHKEFLQEIRSQVRGFEEKVDTSVESINDTNPDPDPVNEYRSALVNPPVVKNTTKTVAFNTRGRDNNEQVSKKPSKRAAKDQAKIKMKNPKKLKKEH